MRAVIKTTKWVEFMYNHLSYGFIEDNVPGKKEKMFVRPVKDNEDDPLSLFLIVTMDKELHLVTPMGESPFMETHKKEFEDLLDEGFIEFQKGQFD